MENANLFLGSGPENSKRIVCLARPRVQVRDILRAFSTLLCTPATFGQVYQIGSMTPWELDRDIPYIASRLG